MANGNRPHTHAAGVAVRRRNGERMDSTGCTGDGDRGSLEPGAKVTERLMLAYALILAAAAGLVGDVLLVVVCVPHLVALAWLREGRKVNDGLP